MALSCARRSIGCAMRGGSVPYFRSSVRNVGRFGSGRVERAGRRNINTNVKTCILQFTAQYSLYDRRKSTFVALVASAAAAPRVERPRTRSLCALASFERVVSRRKPDSSL